MADNLGANTLMCSLKCPKCGAAVTSGVGFRAGVITRGTYNLGDKIAWTGGPCRPAQRPAAGNWQTIGYFECENLKCSTWEDCYPAVQEALITIADDVITGAVPTTHKPDQINFDVIEPKDGP